MPKINKKDVEPSKEEMEHALYLVEEHLQQGGNVRGLDSDVMQSAYEKLFSMRYGK